MSDPLTAGNRAVLADHVIGSLHVLYAFWEATGQIGAAVRFEDQDFLDEVNGALNEMKEDGTLMEILESYGLTEDYFIGVDEGKTENVQ